MKKFFICLLLLPVVLFFTGCGSSKAKQNDQLIVENKGQSGKVEQTKVASGKKVALVMKTLTNPFFVEMEKGARKAEEEFGVSLIVKTGAKETSIEQQIAIVEEFIQSKVDAIVIAPGSSTELIPVLKKAQEAKIPIINVDNRLDEAMSKQVGLLNVPYISVNNEQGAYLAAKFISDKITSPTDVVILEGIRIAKNAQDRKAGAERAFGENKNIRLVASETANWKIDEANKVTAGLFSQYPNIGAIFCANDMMALGAMEYLGKNAKNGVLVASFDALDEAKSAIKQGKLAVTIDQQAAEQGYMGIKYAVQAIKGEKLPNETFIDVKVVSAETLK